MEETNSAIVCDVYGIIEEMSNSDFYKDFTRIAFEEDVRTFFIYKEKVEELVRFNGFKLDNPVIFRRVGVVLSALMEQVRINRYLMGLSNECDVVSLDQRLAELLDSEFNIKLSNVR